MEYPKEQTDELKRYCASLSSFVEGQTMLFLLEGLLLPPGCTPAACDALLCPVPRDGYPSRLYLAVKVTGPFERNWNVSNARIGERNWFAFSWKFEAPAATLAQILLGHLVGFTKEK